MFPLEVPQYILDNDGTPTRRVVKLNDEVWVVINEWILYAADVVAF